MGYLYAFQRGFKDSFKVGKTDRALRQRMGELQNGALEPLSVYGYIETPHSLEAERFMHRFLAASRADIGENFTCAALEIDRALAACTRYLHDELPAILRVQQLAKEFETADTTGRTLPADESATSLADHIRTLDASVRAVKQQLAAHQAERDQCVASLKVLIGNHDRIEGAAAWRWEDGRQTLRDDLLRQERPDLFQQYCSKIDKTQFKADHPKIYAQYQQPSRSRVFRLANPAAQED